MNRKKVLILFLLFAMFFGFSLLEAKSRITRFEVIPNNITIKGGHQVRFTAIAYTSKGTVYTPTNVRWYATGGTMNQDGTYTAGSNSGSFTITATCAGFRGTSLIKIKVKQPGSNIARIIITPSNINLKPGKGYNFKATAYDRYNRIVSFSPTWSTTGGAFINGRGYFEAKYPGTYTIKASKFMTNIYGTATAIVRNYTPPPPTSNIVRLSIFPPSASVKQYQRANFSVKAYDSYNREVPCSPYWNTNGGTITQNGWFTASGRTGHFQITVRDQASGISSTASVKVYGSGGHHPHPPVSNVRIQIYQWDVGGGNFFAPKAKIKCKIYGYGVQTAKLYSVSSSGKMYELQALSCKNGSDLYFKTKYDRFNSKWFEIRVYDNRQRILAKERRIAK